MVVFQHQILFAEAEAFGEQPVEIALIAFVVVMMMKLEGWKKMLLVVR